MRYIFNITPVAKPRMTQRDKWLDPPRPAVAKYLAFKDELAWKAKLEKFKLPDQYIVDLFLPMPKSWSVNKKWKMDNTGHQRKPDKDNLEKALMDVLRPEGDESIWDSRVRKFWSRNPRIVIYLPKAES